MMTPPPVKDAKASAAFSDFFPPSLVKDLRQSFKNPLYMTLVILGILFMGFTSSVEVGFFSLLACVIGLFGFLIPMRAGMTVASDLKERGSNFMMLSPLSPGKIVWGQFLSCLLQVLVLCLMVMPILHHAACIDVANSLAEAIERGYSERSIELAKNKEMIDSYIFSASLFVGLLSGSAFLVAFMMLLSIIPLIGRLVIGVFAPIVLVSLFFPNIIYGTGWAEVQVNLLQYAPMLWVGAFLLLLLARRHYASPSELSSGAVRGLCLLYVLGASAWYYMNPFEPSHLNHLLYCLLIVLSALALDELLPRDSMTRKIRRHCFLLSTNTLMTFVTMLVCVAVLAAGVYYSLQSRLPELEAFVPIYLKGVSAADFSLQMMLCFVCLAVACMYSFFAPLLLTNMVMARSNKNRLIVFACSILALSVLIIIVGSSCKLEGPDLFPFFAVNAFGEYWSDFARFIPSASLMPERPVWHSRDDILRFINTSWESLSYLGGLCLVVALLCCCVQRRR